MSTPWLKFYPSDWRADPALRVCSIAARGLWMEMLCVMHEAEPRGTLRVNGKPLNDRQLAGLAGCSEIEALLSELEDAGVFSRDEAGTIFSRRMMRDEAKAEEDKANGKRGGNPSITRGVNPPVKGRDKAQKPEAINQTKDAIASKTRANKTAFEAWYAVYPHKVQRGAAEKAFLKAIHLAGIEELIAGVHRYIASKPADRNWQNPATWLNGKGWLDVPAQVSTSPPSQKRNYYDVAIDKFSGQENGPASIFGNDGDVKLLPAGRREPRPDDGNLRGGIGLRIVSGDR